MATRLVFVTGGCRSGKSSFALRYAGERGNGGVFVATSPVLDAEMEDRVRRHREERRGLGWDTREEQTDIARAVTESPHGAVILVDCLTLWVNNVMHHASLGGRDPGEDDLAALAGEFAAACRARDGLTVAVANEVGMGIVPENALARRFRDLAGRVNQTVAAAADEVYFMVAGLSQRIK